MKRLVLTMFFLKDFSAQIISSRSVAKEGVVDSNIKKFY
jgi:hypothetical protein